MCIKIFDDYIVVSPDLGSVTRSRNFASKIGTGLAIIDKRRPKANVCEVMNIIGDVRGKKVILPVPQEKMIDKFTILPVAPTFAEAIARIYNDKPFTAAFG